MPPFMPFFKPEVERGGAGKGGRQGHVLVARGAVYKPGMGKVGIKVYIQPFQHLVPGRKVNAFAHPFYHLATLAHRAGLSGLGRR